jgi:hypothetical protein
VKSVRETFCIETVCRGDFFAETFCMCANSSVSTAPVVCLSYCHILRLTKNRNESK